MATESKPDQILVFEVAIPGMDVAAIQEEIEEGLEDVPLQFVLGHASNQVVIVWQGAVEEGEEIADLGTYTGWVTRAYLADDEWVQMASDKVMKPPPEDDEEDGS